MQATRSLGFVLRVLGGAAFGTAAGAIGGLLLTAINNLVLVRCFGAAEGSYAFWTMSLGKLLLAPSVVASIIWGLAFLRKQPGAPTRRGSRFRFW